MPRSAKPLCVGPALDFTLAAIPTRANALRPLIGNSSTRLFSMTWPTVASSVFTSGTSPSPVRTRRLAECQREIHFRALIDL